MMFSAMGRDRFCNEKGLPGETLVTKRRTSPLFAIIVTALSIGLPSPRLQSQTPEQSPPQTPPASSEVGQQLFSSTCAGCHGLDGRGGEHAPNIATIATVQNLPDNDLLRIVHDGIQSAGMPGFGSRFSDGQLKAIVRYLRVLQGKQAAISLPGNAGSGRALFFGKAQCAKCHAIEGQGGFIAADLSGYGRTHTVDEMRRAITDPNRYLDPRHYTVTVVTREGKKFSGVARNEDNFSLQLQTPDGAFHMFDKKNLARVEHEPRSIMPADYGSTLSREELSNLIRYLADAGANRPAGTNAEDE
jgi:putative heme-binding domain-containing protein